MFVGFMFRRPADCSFCPPPQPALPDPGFPRAKSCNRAIVPGTDRSLGRRWGARCVGTAAGAQPPHANNTSWARCHWRRALSGSAQPCAAKKPTHSSPLPVAGPSSLYGSFEHFGASLPEPHGGCTYRHTSLSKIRHDQFLASAAGHARCRGFFASFLHCDSLAQLRRTNAYPRIHSAPAALLALLVTP